MSAGIDYTFIIQPKKTGTFRIGPARVAVKGKTIQSNTETLMVVKPARSSGAAKGALFLSAGLSSSKVYVEEQVIYILKLYRRVKVRDISLNLPETEHLTFRQLGKHLEYQGVYNGRSYYVLEVRYAMIPSKEGKYAIGPSRMNMTVLLPGKRSPRGLFDDPFFPFSTGRPMTLASEALELNVLQLPEAGRPADFSGLVGSFAIESKLDPPEIKTGESATLTVSIMGHGNVNRIPDLKMPDLDHTKVYADQPVLEVESDSKGQKGSKTMKWALVPEVEGIWEIPPLKISFFDTKSQKYQVIETSPLALSAMPGEKKGVQIDGFHEKRDESEAEGPHKQEVKELGRDILPVHTSLKYLDIGFRFQPGSLFLATVLFTPLFIYLATFLVIRLRDRSTGSLAVLKARKAAKSLTKKCRRERLTPSDLTLSVRDYLNDRFDLSIGSLTPDEAAEILKSEGVSPDAAGELQAILKRLENDIYTGKGHEPCHEGEGILKLIRRIEKETR